MESFCHSAGLTGSFRGLTWEWWILLEILGSWMAVGKDIRTGRDPFHEGCSWELGEPSFQTFIKTCAFEGYNGLAEYWLGFCHRPNSFRVV